MSELWQILICDLVLHSLRHQLEYGKAEKEFARQKSLLLTQVSSRNLLALIDANDAVWIARQNAAFRLGFCLGFDMGREDDSSQI